MSFEVFQNVQIWSCSRCTHNHKLTFGDSTSDLAAPFCRQKAMLINFKWGFNWVSALAKQIAQSERLLTSGPSMTPLLSSSTCYVQQKPVHGTEFFIHTWCLWITFTYSWPWSIWCELNGEDISGNWSWYVVNPVGFKKVLQVPACPPSRFPINIL